VVKRPSRDASNVEVRVRLLAGVLVDASMVKGKSRGSAKPEFLVRFQVEALWPNPKRMRDPAVNRLCVGSTPTGHLGQRTEDRGQKTEWRVEE
jgi:hypothetical protein